MGFDYIFRILSYPVSYILYLWSCSPNGISLLSILFTLCAGVCVVLISPVYGILLFIIGYVLDFCDGNLARVLELSTSRSKKSKNLGAILENLNTNISNVTFAVSLGFYFLLENDSVIAVAIGVLFSFIVILYRYTKLHIQNQYNKSIETQKHTIFFQESYIKYFFSKALFNLSSYYPIVLLVFLVLPASAETVFVLYLTLGTFYTFCRFSFLFWQNFRSEHIIKS